MLALKAYVGTYSLKKKTFQQQVLTFFKWFYCTKIAYAWLDNVYIRAEDSSCTNAQRIPHVHLLCMCVKSKLMFKRICKRTKAERGAIVIRIIPVIAYLNVPVSWKYRSYFTEHCCHRIPYTMSNGQFNTFALTAAAVFTGESKRRARLSRSELFVLYYVPRRLFFTISAHKVSILFTNLPYHVCERVSSSPISLKMDIYREARVR